MLTPLVDTWNWFTNIGSLVPTPVLLMLHHANQDQAILQVGGCNNIECRSYVWVQRGYAVQLLYLQLEALNGNTHSLKIYFTELCKLITDNATRTL